jgi:hypothetical protein
MIKSPGRQKKHVFGSCGGIRGGKLPNSCLRFGCHGIMTKILNITARRYNFVSVTWRSIRAVPSTRDGTLARKLSRCKEGMAHFLPSRYKFCEIYECRGTRLIGAANLSPVTKLGEGTGVVSRYKDDRSQVIVTVQDDYYGQLRVSR